MERGRIVSEQNGSYLNPSTLKIKNSFLKKAKRKEEMMPVPVLGQGMPGEEPIKRSAFNTEDRPQLSNTDSQTLSLEMTRKKETQPVSLPKQRLEHHEYSFIIDRNQHLLEEVRTKDMKIEALGRRCEQL
jgi:hypothetical protein